MEGLDAQKLLDKYIYDYMKRKNMHETAKIFAEETEIDEREVGIDSAEGFLKEWWSLFWDTYCSRLSLASEGIEETSEIVLPTGNVPQYIPPITPRSILAPRLPTSQQSIENMLQRNPFASVKRPQLIQQALNSMPTAFPLLPKPETFQQFMDAIQMSSSIVPRPDLIQQAMNVRPDLIQQAMNVRPEMIQQAMNVMQTPYPVLLRPEINQQVRSGMPGTGIPLFNPDFSAKFAVSPRFGVHHREMPTLFSKMYDQEYLKCSSTDLTDHLQLLDAGKVTQMLASARNSSQQHQIPVEIQRQKMFEKIQAQLAKDAGPRVKLETSKDAVPVPQEAAQAAVQERDVYVAGKGKSVQRIPVQDHLVGDVGSFSPGTRQPNPAFSGSYLPYHLAKPDVQNYGRPTIPASGSYCNLPSRTLFDFNLGKVLELPGNAQIGCGTVVQQQVPGLEIAKETVITNKQKSPKLKRHNSKESVKRKNPSDFLPVPSKSGVRKRKNLSSVLPNLSKLDGSNAEGQNSMNEGTQLNILDVNDNCNDPGTPFSTLEQTSSDPGENAWKGFSFKEFGSHRSPNNKLLSCHFTTTGSLLAGAGEKKILIWNMENLSADIIDAHSDIITDIRFRPNSTIFATSSNDTTLQIWDASKPANPPSKLGGHFEPVTSLDFHPRKGDVLCSCDSSFEMRIWNITGKTCVHIAQGGGRQVRFQPQHGDFLASASGNIINLIDVETNKIIHLFKGHDKDVRSLCWDNSGTYLASVSEDSARMWTINFGERSIHQLDCTGSKFESCTFHPVYAQLTVIGTNQTLELWNPTDSNITRSYRAHDGAIAALANSPHTETIASASHDSWLKLWK